MLTLDKIYHAAFVLKNVVRETNLTPSPKLNPACKNVYLKTENLQLTGSFKVRGAGYMISQLTEEERREVLLLVLPEIMRKVLRLLRKNTVSDQ